MADAASLPIMSLPSFEETSNNQLLTAAWERQKVYSNNASRYEERFIILRILIAALNVLVVVLAVLQQPASQSQWGGVLDVLLLMLPITITALLAFSVQFDGGQSWILLRGNAEALKMEIYYYRTRVGTYGDNRDVVLAKQIKLFSERMKGSPVHQGALSPYEEEEVPTFRTGLLIRLVLLTYKGLYTLFNNLWRILFQWEEQKSKDSGGDDKYSDLTDPEKYLTCRLENQFNWYRRKAKKLARQLQMFQAGVYLFGGVGTLLAASELKSWVAMTTSLTGAFTNYLEFKRVEANLIGYNQAADALYDIRAWWLALSAAERDQPENFKKLVESCEETIRNEHASWLQDMQDRLAKLYGTGDDDQSDDDPKADEGDVSKQEQSNNVRG